MRAVQIVATGQPLADADVPVPDIGPDDVLVEVRAAGICHSDVHYRRGPRTVRTMPMAPGHEIAGVVVEAGSAVSAPAVGERVAIHYQTSCGACRYCARGSEQFCSDGSMFGNGRPGGYADYVLSPARNAFTLPDEIGFEHGAVMMCSSATSLHALRKGRLVPGESVAVFGAGGLGMSAVQIARAFGAARVYAVDLNAAKLALAASFGAIPIDAGSQDPVEAIRREGGVDVSLELIGLPVTMRQAIEVLAPFGRAVVVGLGGYQIDLAPFDELTLREAEIIGCADHLAQELPQLFDLAVRGALDLDPIVGACVPLDAAHINWTMDRMEEGTDVVRTVIKPSRGPL